MKIRRTVVSQSCDGRTDEAKIIGPFGLRPGTKNRALYVYSLCHKESIKKKIMKIRRTVVSQTRPDWRMDERMYEAKIIGPFGLRPGTKNI